MVYAAMVVSTLSLNVCFVYLLPQSLTRGSLIASPHIKALLVIRLLWNPVMMFFSVKFSLHIQIVTFLTVKFALFLIVLCCFFLKTNFDLSLFYIYFTKIGVGLPFKGANSYSYK